MKSENSQVIFLEVIFTRSEGGPEICMFASFLGGFDELDLSVIISWSLLNTISYAYMMYYVICCLLANPILWEF